MENEFICTHILNFEKGQIIRNTDHKRPKSQTLEKYQEQVLGLFNKSEIAKNYLQLFRKNKSRYYRDNLQYILKNHGNYEAATIHNSLLFCIENKVFNAKTLIDILNNNQKGEDNITYGPSVSEINTVQTDEANLHQKYNNVETSDINKYENIFR